MPSPNGEILRHVCASIRALCRPHAKSMLQQSEAAKRLEIVAEAFDQLGAGRLAERGRDEQGQSKSPYGCKRSIATAVADGLTLRERAERAHATFKERMHSKQLLTGSDALTPVDHGTSQSRMEDAHAVVEAHSHLNDDPARSSSIAGVDGLTLRERVERAHATFKERVRSQHASSRPEDGGTDE